MIARNFGIIFITVLLIATVAPKTYADPQDGQPTPASKDYEFVQKFGNGMTITAIRTGNALRMIYFVNITPKGQESMSADTGMISNDEKGQICKITIFNAQYVLLNGSRTTAKVVEFTIKQ